MLRKHTLESWERFVPLFPLVVLVVFPTDDVDSLRIESFDPLDPSQGQNALICQGTKCFPWFAAFAFRLNSCRTLRAIVMRYLVVLTLTSIFSSLIVAHLFPISSNVQTSSGAIIGHAARNWTRVAEYLGIPYAKPPLGDLRFAAPQTYSSTQTYNASNFVSSCSSLENVISPNTKCVSSHRMYPTYSEMSTYW